MGRHGHDDRGYRTNDARRDDRLREMRGGATQYDAPPRLPRKLPLAVVLGGLVLWSLLAWIGYSLVDPVLAWVASSAGLLVDGGKAIATAAGGKEVGTILDTVNTGGLLGQVIALLGVVLKPIIVVVWAIGALLLVVAGFMLPNIGRLMSGRRH